MVVVTTISKRAKEALKENGIHCEYGFGDAYHFRGVPGASSSVDIPAQFTLGDTAFIVVGERLLLADEKRALPRPLIAAVRSPASTPSVLPSQTFCPACGAANRASAGSCSACGASMRSPGGAGTPPPVPANVPGGQGTATGMLAANQWLTGRYLILGRVGQGGMGAVYRALDTRARGQGKVVAVKEMRQRGLSHEELAEATTAFRREATLLSGLHHPSLPAISDHFAEGGRWYLVMDFIEGETVEDSLARTGTPLDPAQPTPTGRYLPVDRVLDLGARLAGVLGYLHTRQPPVIFRDLKPANVMLTPEGRVVLIDFGIARLFTPGKSRDTVALGSPGYAAPEQYGRATSPRSDSYGLGAALHHLVTGIDPDPTLGGNPFVKAPLATVGHLRGVSVLAPLDALLQEMMRIDEQQRPATMAAVEQRLQALLTALRSGSSAKALVYQGQTFWVRLVAIQYGSHPSHEPGDPLYHLCDAAGVVRYTLWWAHGLPEFAQGRVLRIEEYTPEHPYPAGVMKPGELFVEKTTGFAYVDNR